MDTEAEDLTYRQFQHGYAPASKNPLPEYKSLKDAHRFLPSVTSDAVVYVMF